MYTHLLNSNSDDEGVIIPLHTSFFPFRFLNQIFIIYLKWYSLLKRMYYLVGFDSLNFIVYKRVTTHETVVPDPRHHTTHETVVLDPRCHSRPERVYDPRSHTPPTWRERCTREYEFLRSSPKICTTVINFCRTHLRRSGERRIRTFRVQLK